MKFTLSWLKQHLVTEASLDEILTVLTRIGLEVESVEDKAADLKAFTVGYVREAVQHPNADKLRVCQVETAGGNVEVVCGAPNARAGIKVAFAAVGSVIPATGLELKAGAIRGVVSNGMLCSSRELKLGDDHDGIMELPADAVVGAPIADVLGLGDPVIDISITPNRGDCNGVAGVARDLAAAGLGHIVTPEVAEITGTFPSPIKTAIADNAAPLFEGRLIRGVKNGPSPAWVQNRLRAVGLRPISALVDVTNLLSLDRARPLHVFDADTLTGNLTARFAKEGEVLVALDSKTYTLDTETVVIADDAAARGIAGVMGGLETGCTEKTVNVFVEAALFEPIRVAAAGRKLSINSDARYRYERGVDPEFNRKGLDLATALILEWCGGEASEVVSAGAIPAWRREIKFDPALVLKLSGVDLPVADVLCILGDLGCTVTGAFPFTVTPPSWRPDIHGAADLVEEVTRIHGLDNIPSTALPRVNAVTKPGLTLAQRRAREARRSLAGRGLVEAVTNSFIPRAHAALFGGGDESMQLANPISAELDAMRPNVLPSLIAAASRNAARGLVPSHLFEVGPAFAGTGDADQPTVATGLRAGTSARQWRGAAFAPDVFAAKADALALIESLGGPVGNLTVWTDAPSWYHPGRSGQLKLGPKTVVARFGELHPAVLEAMDLKAPTAAFEVFLDAIPLPKAKPTKTKAALVLSDYPAVERDFAFLVADRVAAGDVVKAAAGADKVLIAGVDVFDVYAGKGVAEGHKSLAIAVRLQPKDRTLTDAEIDVVGQKIVAAVTKATGGTLRA
ncbi:Phenylalanine--tRNA ligase beta subunit [Alphaproteobacteria bacterium SO-S41]|nr:Phenylalanine--tRNA ligase beta subunit [Alphaproteobacteria bacterium SO-S41]